MKFFLTTLLLAATALQFAAACPECGCSKDTNIIIKKFSDCCEPCCYNPCPIYYYYDPCTCQFYPVCPSPCQPANQSPVQSYQLTCQSAQTPSSSYYGYSSQPSYAYSNSGSSCSSPCTPCSPCTACSPCNPCSPCKPCSPCSSYPCCESNYVRYIRCPCYCPPPCCNRGYNYYKTIDIC